jgi:hypothetical protein
VGEQSARILRQVGSRRRVAAAALAVLSSLAFAFALGAGRLVRPLTTPQSAASPATRPGSLVAALFSGTLPAVPPGSVSVTLAVFTLPIGAQLELPAGSGPVLLGLEVGAARARVGGSTTLLAATPEAVSPPFQVAAGGDTGLPGLKPGLVVPAGEVIELTNAGTVPATGAFVAFGTTTMPAPDGTAIRLLAGGQLDPPPAGPLRAEVTRWSLAPGAIMPASVVADSELLAVAEGSVELALRPGEAVIQRSYGGAERVSGGPGDPLAALSVEDEGHEHEAESSDPVQSAGPPSLRGSVVGLAAGDAAVLRPGSIRTLQGIGPAPAVVWVVALVPAEPVPGTPPP